MIDSTINVVSNSKGFEKRIRETLRVFPAWLVRSARISRIVEDSSPEMREMLASYRHEDRSLHVYPNLGLVMLTRAIGHELWHGADDNFDSKHYFSSYDVWGQVHRDQPYFDIPKYRDEPLEYFADIGVKYSILGRDKMMIVAPRETMFFEGVVIPILQNAFGKD